MINNQVDETSKISGSLILWPVQVTGKPVQWIEAW
jgi:hypothetical protein